MYEWDEGDYNLLMSAKRGELVQAGVPNPPSRAIQMALTREELLRHCRCRTRGEEETIHLIHEMPLLRYI